MKKKISVIMLVLIISLLTFVGADGSPATVPFKGSYQTFPVGVPADGYLALTIPAVGKATHLGNSEWYADSKAYIFQECPCPQTGEMFFTAANGDKLFGTFAGLAVPNDGGGFDYWGDYSITEGTGRFNGTTGSGTYYGGAAEGTGTLIFEGTLMNP